MDSFDFVIIGAGPGGEAAAYKARELGASVAVIDRLWFGGSCPHIGCLPSKSLLDGAARHWANPARYNWAAASTARDYMVNRPADAEEPDDGGHVRGLEDAGATVYRGNGAITGRGRVTVTHDGVVHELTARDVMVAVGSVSKRPPIEGLDDIPTWTNREATLTRALPRSLVVLGGGQPAASSPRSTRDSRFRPSSSSRVHVSHRPTTRGTPRQSGRHSSATA